jgi:hypothetical protein
MSDEPIDLSNLMNLQFRPDWVEDLAKKDAAPGEVVWGRAPGGREREDRGERPRHGGGPRRDGGRGFDRGPRPDSRGPRPDSRGPRPDNRGPRQDFRRGPQGQGERRPPPPGGQRDDRGPRRDDRSGGRPPFRDRHGDPRGDHRGPRNFDAQSAPPLEGWAASLLPEPGSLESIARQIKASGRAFSVFDVGRLFMQSRERYLVRFSRRDASPVKQKEGQPPQAAPPQPAPPPRGPREVYQCAADGSLWLSRDEALRHILRSPAIQKYYRTETVTVEAPKGNWNAVAVCGFSGALLGPPNHHDYQRNVARLHRERFSDMPLDRYKSRIRVEKDEALLTKWQEQQSSTTHWIPVPAEPLPGGAEPPAALTSAAEMEAHFMRTHADTAVAAVTKALVSGNIPGRSLAPGLLALLRREVEHQQRFPMQLVQDLCRALESHGLRFFKRDRKTTFVSRNRPHFLPDDLVLSERIRTMVEIVRANPGIKYSQLVSILAPNVVLAAPPSPPGAKASSAEDAAPVEARVEITTESPATASGEPAAAEAASAEPESVVAPAAEAEISADTPPAEIPATSAVEAPAPDIFEAATAPAVADTPVAETAGEAAAPEAAGTEAPAAEPAPAPAPPPVHLSPEEIAILQDLHWLVQEGFVTEFQNGELFVLGRPPQPPAEKKPRGPRPDKPVAGADTPAAEAPAPPDAGEVNEVTAADIATSPSVSEAAAETPPAAEEPAAVPGIEITSVTIAVEAGEPQSA